MRKLRFVLGALVASALFAPANAAVVFDGFTFDENAFADAVVSVIIGNPAPRPTAQDGSTVLGQPDASPSAPTSFATGQGGQITIQFVDNRLTGNGSSAADLVIFERGSLEATFVELSIDGINFFSAGRTPGGVSAIDIDAALATQGLAPTTQIAFVRLLDDPSQGAISGSTVGPDIDAIGALSNVAVPIPGAALLFVPALVAMRFFKRKAH